MPYCGKCGKQLADGAKFCFECGGKADISTTSSTSQRKIVYEGEVHKCPNCGEVLASFTANCPACGFEIRGVSTTDYTMGLLEKIESIDARQTPTKRRSVMKTMFGADFGEKDEDEERKRFEEQKKKEKANLIISYPVPNTREGILEFMFLTSTNIRTKLSLDALDDDDIVNKAWITKMDQILKQAELIMKNSADLEQVRSIYNKKKAELKNRKFKGFSIAAYVIGAFVLFEGILLEEIISILLGIILLLAGIGFTKIYIKNKKNYT